MGASSSSDPWIACERDRVVFGAMLSEFWTRMLSEARRCRVLGLSVGLVLVLTRPEEAWAQQRAAAEVLFEEGRKAMDQGDYDTACAKFEESNRLDVASGTTLNLANCEEARGHVASAWERYRAAVRLLAEGDRRREFAKSKVKQLEPLVPHLTIELSNDAPPETQVSRNGKTLTASFGVPLPLDPGQYTITVMAPGRLSSDYEVTLEPGERKSINVEPGDVVDTPPEETETKVVVQRDDGATARTLGYVFGGIGVAALAGTGVFGYMAYQNKRTVEDDCDLRTSGDIVFCRSNAGPRAKEEGERNALLANVLAAAAGVSLGVGLYFYFTAEDPPAAKLEAGVFRGAPGLQVTGSF
jgi:tetratricopeptide (TPR) repeat protein